MDYKTLMGYGNKKKVVKEQPKPKVNKILESVKEELEDNLSGLEIRKQKAEKLVYDIKGLETRKSVAQSDLDRLFKSQGMAEEKIASLEDSFDSKSENLKEKQLELEKKYESFSDRVDIAENKIKKVENERDNKLKELEEDVSHKDAELKAINSLIDKAEDEYIAWEKKIKKVKGLVDIENRKVQTVKDAYERWKINTLEQVAKLKLKNKIDLIDKAGLAEILGNG